MRTLRWMTTLVFILVLAGCSSGSSEFTATNSAQRAIKDGVAATITLDSGASVHFPAQAFSSDVQVMFADLLQSKDGDATYYPTGSNDPEDLLAGVIVNTPADQVIRRDITVTFAFRAGLTATAGDRFILYRFDYEDDNDSDSTGSRWNRWGNRYATVSATTSTAGRTLATVTLPTYDLIGYIGSLAIFDGHTVPVPMAEVDPANSTWIEGYAMGSGNNGVATDVAIYVAVGAKMYAVDVLNTNARTPVLPGVSSNYIINGRENTITSDADGFFRFYIPENLIGQFVAIEFGRESANFSTEDNFYLVRPEVAIADTAAVPTVVGNDANLLLDDTKNMVVRYGLNTVVSYPIGSSS